MVSAVLLCSAVNAAASELKSFITVINNKAAGFMFNGVEKPLPSDMTVLLHNDRVYVPARFVAEELGATVDWNSSREMVIIWGPTAAPGTTSSPATATPTPSGVISTPDKHFFQRLPLKLIEKEMYIQVYQIDTLFNSQVSIRLELENRSQGTLFYQFSKAYIVVDNEKTMALERGDSYYSIGLDPTEKLDVEIIFNKHITDVTDIKLVLPFNFMDVLRNEMPMEFTFYIDSSNVN